MGRIHTIRIKEFDGGYLKIEMLETPPTIYIVAYVDKHGNEVRPEKLVRILKYGELPLIFHPMSKSKTKW